MEQRSDVRFKLLPAAIAESKPQAEFAATRPIVSLAERIAVLEAQSH